MDVPGCQDFINIEEYPDPIQLHTYPNPATDILNIYYYNHNFTSNSEIQVFDIQGRMVHSWKLNSNNVTYVYDVSLLTPGTYILNIVDNKGSTLRQEKFIKL